MKAEELIIRCEVCGMPYNVRKGNCPACSINDEKIPKYNFKDRIVFYLKRFI